MNARIRRANSSDASAIARIMMAVFSEHIDVQAPRTGRILSAGFTLVAAIDGEIVGFAHNFLSQSASAARRFELDLLAIDVAARGQGLGQALVAATIALARQAKAANLRALVRLENRAMQRVCRQGGFERSSQSYSLFVAAPRAPAQTIDGCQHRAHLIQVETLNYSGIWLEGTLCQNAIDSAQGLALQSGAQLLGAVIAQSDAATAGLLRQNAFEPSGDYHWWTLSLESEPT